MEATYEKYVADEHTTRLVRIAIQAPGGNRDRKDDAGGFGDCGLILLVEAFICLALVLSERAETLGDLTDDAAWGKKWVGGGGEVVLNREGERRGQTREKIILE